MSTISSTAIVATLHPMLHAAGIVQPGTGATDLIHWNSAQLSHWVAEWIKRHAQMHGVFVVHDQTILLADGTATYDAPAHHLDTIHVMTSTASLIASSTTELEALDPSFFTTVETTGNITNRWYADRVGANTIGVYPVPATGFSDGDALEIIYHGYICDDPFTAPLFVQDYLTLAVYAEAVASESDGQMVEAAQSARAVMSLIDEVVNAYWGRAQ